MSKITREDIGAQHAKVTLVLDVADYEAKYNAELKKLKGKVQLKGFRKGKTPLSFLKKTYGESVLADVVFKKVSETMDQYFKDEKLHLIGNPIPSDDANKINIDPVNLTSYTLNYEIGYLPEWKIDGISKDKTLEICDVEVPEKWINDDIERFKKQLGERKEVDEKIEEGDVVRVKGIEQDNGKAKEGGVESEFDVFFDSLSEDAQILISGKKPGDKFTFDVFKLEDNMTEEMAKKYLLKLEGDDLDKEVNGDFEMEVLTVTRVFPAELNKENLEKVFGPESGVEDEAGARAKLEEHAKKGFEQGINNLFFTDAIDYINEQNDVSVPSEFFKKWLTFEASQKEGGIEPTDEQVEEEIKNYKKRTIITKLMEANEVKVEMAPLKANMKARLNRMMQGQQMGGDFYDSMVEKMLGDPQYRDFVDESTNEVAMDGLSNALKEQFDLKPVKMDFDTFKAKIDELNARYQPPAPPVAEAEEEEDEEEEEEVSTEEIFK